MGPKGCTGGANKFMCPCVDMTSGFATKGICVSNFTCKATSAADGKLDPGMAQLGKILSDLMQKLMQGGQGGAGDSPPPPITGTQGCTQYFQTSDISQVSNPCAQYVPAVSEGITTTDSNGCDPLSAVLGMCGGENANTNANINTGSSTGTSVRPAATTTPRIIFQPTGVGGIGVPGGFRGDILTRDRGATAIAGARDEKSNVEVAGFYGSDTFGGQSAGLMARWCRERPWASNFLGKIVDPGVFDVLCKARGYQVGEPPPPSQGTVVRVNKAPVATSTPKAATSTPTVKPKVDIWAVPASVPLGARTSIFWSAQGVVSCVETSTDGSFNQRSLSGGAATVPITMATTFTIECDVSDGTKIRGSATVNLKI